MIRSRMERGKYFPIFRDIDFFKLYIYIDFRLDHANGDGILFIG